jgi:hypothetical protein
MKIDNYSSTSISMPGNIGSPINQSGAGSAFYAKVRAIEGGKYGSWTAATQVNV